MDPKVEFKREGMRTFDLMWKGIDERVTDIVYRIEQVEDDALRSTWRETAATHADAAPLRLPDQAAELRTHARIGTYDGHASRMRAGE